MIPLIDDVSKDWFARGTWFLIIITAFLSILSLNVSEQLQVHIVQEYAFTNSTENIVGNLLLRMITSMHLHTDYKHLLFNMVFLFAFGLSVEKKIGTCKFIVIYYAAGCAGWILFAIMDKTSDFAIGASGAISGIIATYFLLFPRAKFLTVILVLWIVKFFYIRAGIYIFIWIAFQFFSSFFDTTSHVAYQAHLGGVILGLCLGAIIKFQLTGRERIA